MLRSIKEKSFFHPFIIWFYIVLWFFIFSDKFFYTTNLKLANFISEQSFWFFSDPPKVADKITIVAIDDVSRESLNLKWPWKRSVTAQLISNIASLSPKVIGLDFVFSGKSEEREDKKLISAFKAHPQTVLGYRINKDFQEKPLKAFIEATSSMGFVNKPLQDGVVDRIRTFNINGSNEIEYSIDIEILKHYLDIDNDDLSVNEQGIVIKDRFFIPSPQGITPLNYLVYPTNFTTIPASLVLQNKVNPSHFKDKIVLVGATDPLMHDEFSTPLGVLPGVTVIGNSLVMLLSNHFLYSASTQYNLLFIFTLGLLIIFINSKVKILSSTVFTLFLLGATYFVFIYLRAQDIQFSYLPIFFSGISAYIIPNFYRYLNLAYLSNQLKDMALTDPLTGFHSSRFFLLQLDEKLKLKKGVTFIAIKIANYKRLSLQLSFEQIKLFNKRFSEQLQSELSHRYKIVSVSHLSNDIFGIVIEGTSKEKLKSFLATFVESKNRTIWTLEDTKVRLTLKGCLLQVRNDSSCSSNDVIYEMQNIFENMTDNQIVVEELQESTDKMRKVKHRDILDFIAYDWEERNKELEQSLKEILETNKKLNELNWGALHALARSVDAKSRWTAGHSSRVTQMALKIGRVMGLTPEELDTLKRAGLVHDIGKIGIPNEIINKSGKLTDEEYSIMKEHPAKGGRILQPIKAYEEIIPMVTGHHEWYNGKGYPDGLKGEEICLGGRILALADVYDALIYDRPYRKGLPLEKVIAIIEEGNGTQYDPKVVAAFLKVIEPERRKPENQIYDQSSLPDEEEFRIG
jgi:putative nucleotidyltransferase with HDIG domain